jgi:inosine/xanthosine triphosphate pyrophosphatase family protein/dephospho-CoA kinase
MIRPRYGDAFRFHRTLNIYFYTSNTDKLLQARLVFMRHGYQLRHYRGVQEPYDEDYSLDTTALLTRALNQLSSEFRIRSLFFVEDTSLRIEAFSDTTDFPGLAVKEWFSRTSFTHLDRALKCKKKGRRATVKSDIALNLPTLSRPLFFHGSTTGSIADGPPQFAPSSQYPWLTPNTFNGWFIPDNSLKRLGEMEFEESLEYDFRVKSLCALLERFEELNAAINSAPILYTVGTSTHTASGQLSLLDRVGPATLLVIGPKCAGKTTLSDYLARRPDCLSIEASSVLREIANEAGEAVETPSDAMRFLTRSGMDIVAARIAKILDNKGGNLTVITGLRTVEEVLYLLQTRPEVRIVLVDADIKVRFERHRRRARDADVQNLGAFMDQDEKQAQFGILRIGTEICDASIRNDGDMTEYHNKIEGVLADSQTADFRTNHATTTSELLRSLRALKEIGRAATCAEISDMTYSQGARVRKYNTNRALKGAPEFATRVQRNGSLLRYMLTPRGQKVLILFDLLATRRRAQPNPAA